MVSGNKFSNSGSNKNYMALTEAQQYDVCLTKCLFLCYTLHATWPKPWKTNKFHISIALKEKRKHPWKYDRIITYLCSSDFHPNYPGNHHLHHRPKSLVCISGYHMWNPMNWDRPGQEVRHLDQLGTCGCHWQDVHHKDSHTWLPNQGFHWS